MSPREWPRWVAVVASLLTTASSSAGVIYVDAAAASGGDGTSWPAAYCDLQDGLAAAQANGDVTEVRIAQGIYRPDRGTFNPGMRFQLAGGYTLAGGYAGNTAPDPTVRDPALYETVLSGDLLGNDGADFQNYFDNAQVIVEYLAGGPPPWMTGLTVVAAREHGIFISEVSPVLEECRILRNYAVDGGGGVCVVGAGAATFTGCVFSGNRSELQGGGLWLSGDATATVTDCAFIGNRAAINLGAGQRGGGGVFVDYGTAATPVRFINCLFTANEVFHGQGAALYAYGNAVELVNCTFVRNWHWGGGTGGLFAEGVDPSPERSGLTVHNTIFWANGFTEQAQIKFVDAEAVLERCIVQGWSGTLGGIGNRGANPLLTAIGPPGSLAHDAHLTPGSPCIDAGDNNALPPGVTGDLEGNPRFLDDAFTPDTGVGPPPVVDIGAYEFQAISDCNSNGVRDDLDIAAGTAHDCNTNGRPDTCDLADGGSQDADSNGVPDECADCRIDADCDDDLFCNGTEFCEQGTCMGGVAPCTGVMLCNETLDACLPDCNRNGVDDASDITSGVSLDCNTTGIPDECELTPVRTLIDIGFEAGLPPAWTASGLWHVTTQCARPLAPDPVQWAYFGRPGACDFDTGVVVAGALTADPVHIPTNATSAVLSYASYYEGDRGFAALPFGFDLAWVEVNGQLVDDVGPTLGFGGWEIRDVDLSVFIDQTVTLRWRFDSIDAISNNTLGWQVDAVRLAVVVANDCNVNAVPDDCEDCNGNAFADECDIAAGTSADCDANAVPDECDVLLRDCNSNGIPDPCDPDLDGDGIPDACDADRDGDNVADDIDPCVSAPGEAVNASGGPLGDFNDDCTVTTADHFYFLVCLSISGPHTSPGFIECLDVFDFDADQDIDLSDFAGFQRATAPSAR